jgi:hypothetical protein
MYIPLEKRYIFFPSGDNNTPDSPLKRVIAWFCVVIFFLAICYVLTVFCGSAASHRRRLASRPCHTARPAATQAAGRQKTPERRRMQKNDGRERTSATSPSPKPQRAAPPYRMNESRTSTSKDLQQPDSASVISSDLPSMPPPAYQA